MSADVGALTEWQVVTLRAVPSLAAYVVRLCGHVALHVAALLAVRRAEALARL